MKDFFKVGDKIQAVTNRYKYTSKINNWEGIITSEDKYTFFVETTRTTNTTDDRVGNYWVVSKEDFDSHFAHSKSNNFKLIYEILNG